VFLCGNGPLPLSDTRHGPSSGRNEPPSPGRRISLQLNSLRATYVAGQVGDVVLILSLSCKLRDSRGVPPLECKDSFQDVGKILFLLRSSPAEFLCFYLRIRALAPCIGNPPSFASTSFSRLFCACQLSPGGGFNGAPNRPLRLFPYRLPQTLLSE